MIMSEFGNMRSREMTITICNHITRYTQKIVAEGVGYWYI